VEYVRLPPGAVQVPGGEAIARVRVARTGFYILGVPIVECDPEALPKQLVQEAAMRIGADRVVEVQVEGTPASGWWWFLTHVLPFPPRARACAIAVRNGSGPP
jgi:hypothetical protein